MHTKNHRSLATVWMCANEVFRAAGVLMLLVLIMCYSTVAHSVDLTFKYTVVQGTCTLDVPAGLSLNSVDSVATAVGKSWQFLNQKTLTINLTNCSGAANPNTTPSVSLVSPVMAADGSADRKAKIFSSTTNKTGLGVVLSTTSFSNGSVANLVTRDTYIAAGSKGEALNANKNVVLNVALACGEAADCTGTKVNSGSGDASITFAFTYH